ncbi:MAG: cyclic nucleotide-binding domain-containing protein [Dissulfuribacterales bacterium]
MKPMICFYILEGEVEIFKTMEGRRIIIATLGKGEVFGEIGLLMEGSKRTASARTTKKSMILGLTKEEFLRRITITPTFCLTILKSLSERLQQATSELILLKYVIPGQ